MLGLPASRASEVSQGCSFQEFDFASLACKAEP